LIDNFLSRIFAQPWVAFLFSAALLLGLADAGFRFGRRLHTTKDEARKGQIGDIQGAVLSMLGLLLGFTLAFAVGRYDLRRSLVVKEANAIGTTWLRAALLPDAHVAPVRDLLRRYLEVRLKYQALADDPVRLTEGLRLSGDIEAELWQHATAAAKESPNNITGLFIAALNETIDTDAERLDSMRASVPAGVILLLLTVAAAGCFVAGYNAGTQGARTKLGSVFLPLLYTVVMLLIHDLAHPRQGLIRISQQPLIDLQQTMQPNHPEGR
jgi:hypothetical protein